MNKKRILVYIVAILVVAGSSSFVYASKNSVNVLRNKIESISIDAKKAEVETEKEIGYISDEEAIEIAKKAVKDYLNKDVSNYTDVDVSRQDWSKNTEIEVEGQTYMVSKSYAEWIQYRLDGNDIEGAKQELKRALEDMPSLVMVNMVDKDVPKEKRFPAAVEIDADTREVLSVQATNKYTECNREPDLNKVKETVINYFHGINTEIDEDSILGKYDVDYDYGIMYLHLNLADRRKISVEMEIKDFVIVGYTKKYLRWPSE